MAAAAAETDFDLFLAEVIAHASDVSGNPVRFMTLSHLVNATALVLGRDFAKSKSLIEGCLMEAVTIGRLSRITVLSQAGTPYQNVSCLPVHLSADNISNDLADVLMVRKALSVEEVNQLLPYEMRVNLVNARALMSSLVFRGLANSIDAAASSIELIEWPSV